CDRDPSLRCLRYQGDQVRPAGIGSQRGKPAVPDIGDSEVPSARSAMVLRCAAAARFAWTWRKRSPLWIRRATSSAITGEAIHPVARMALITRSRKDSGATIAPILSPGARHLAKLET